MQHAGRIAKAAGRAAVPVAAGVVATTSQPVAQADAYGADVLSRRRIQDVWEFADLSDKEVLFKPEEIDEALACLTGKPHAPYPSAVIEELDSDISSDGTADAVLERDMRYYAGMRNTSSSSAGLSLGMQDLCTMAGRLLKSPGVQQEILKAACSDPEVFEILASKTDLIEYLESAGFAATGLLASSGTAAAAATANPLEEDDAASTSGSSSSSAEPAAGVLEQLQAKLNEGVVWIGEGVESVGNAVVRLGRWMRSQLTGEEYVAGEDTGRGRRGAAAGVVAALTVAMVAVVAVVVLRMPPAARRQLMARVLKRR
eukprot:GHRQ01000579.1.p1 GENE.GHRQ01000579.1~~GHRQ01000579.1.p1  ORF type:complete len:315 (+),score=139.81 GHRQ01000579.1:119-1063(+)